MRQRPKTMFQLEKTLGGFFRSKCYCFTANYITEQKRTQEQFIDVLIDF